MPIRPPTTADVPLIPQLLAADAGLSAKSLSHLEAVIGPLFPRLFLDTPHADPDIRGFVCEDDGQLSGMIGSVMRRMMFRDRPIRAAVNAELFVAPAARSKMLGLKLFKQVMDGPQDLSISDIGNDISRRIWQGLGGTVASWYGLNWIKVIRPGLLPLSLLSKSRFGKPLAWAGRPLASVGDAILRRAASKFTQLNDEPKVHAELLTPDLVVELFPQFGRAHELRPIYDRATVDWVWERLDFMYRDGGRSQQVLLRSARGEPLGWYIYQLSGAGIARVSQVVAHPHTVGQVLDHLLQHAACRGAVAVIGRVIPRFLQAVCDRNCAILRRSTYLLVHSRDPEIADSFVAGKAFLSLLDGEGPLQIWNNPLEAIERFSSTPSLATDRQGQDDHDQRNLTPTPLNLPIA